MQTLELVSHVRVRVRARARRLVDMGHGPGSGLESPPVREAGLSWAADGLGKGGVGERCGRGELAGTPQGTTTGEEACSGRQHLALDDSGSTRYMAFRKRFDQWSYH
jgi:hypothetical protein